MKNAKEEKPLGAQLVADYQSVFISMATAQWARHQAKDSENEFLGRLTEMSSGGYLQPSNIGDSEQDSLKRASLDAHIKKIQSQQFEELRQGQIKSLSEENNNIYSGKKVEVIPMNAPQTPFDGVWFNSHKGYRSNPINNKKIKGTIKEVNLEKNILIVAPSIGPRLINSELHSYVVYVINPETAEPMVDIKLR